jgi:hypothetical protein
MPDLAAEFEDEDETEALNAPARMALSHFLCMNTPPVWWGEG